MPKFEYMATDAKGNKKNGVLNSDSEQDLISQLRTKGLTPIKITKVDENTRVKKTTRRRKGKLKGKDLMVFTRQLATLLGAGLPLLRALKTLERQSSKKPHCQAVIAEVCSSVEGGSGFADALETHPKSFDRLYVNMVRAGEAAGNLEEVLSRLADYKEKAAKIASKIKSASMYPAVVMSVATIITVLLMVVIVPKFQKIFSDMLGPDEPMPALTEMVIGISNFMKNHFIIMFLMLVALVVIFKVIKATKQGQYLIDYLLLKIPPFNGLVQKANVSQFSRTLGTLQRSGVSILQALKIVHDTTGNQVIAKAVSKVQTAVTEGEPLVKPMSEANVFPDMMISMVEVGEETGELPEMLERVANTYDEEVDNAVDGVISMIEPLLIVGLAIVVGTIVVAMFLPMTKLIETLAG
ncbi:MAG: type II secretion system F family protein [Lentisphaeria bacterium]